MRALATAPLAALALPLAGGARGALRPAGDGLAVFHPHLAPALLAATVPASFLGPRRLGAAIPPPGVAAPLGNVGTARDAWFARSRAAAGAPLSPSPDGRAVGLSDVHFTPTRSMTPSTTSIEKPRASSREKHLVS